MAQGLHAVYIEGRGWRPRLYRGENIAQRWARYFARLANGRYFIFRAGRDRDGTIFFENCCFPDGFDRERIIAAASVQITKGK